MRTEVTPIGERSRTAVLFVAAVALASSLRGLLNDFVYDDIPIIQDNVRVHALSQWLEIVRHPYWPPPFVEQLYRPLSLLFLAAQYVIAGGNPIVFRIVSYALYAVASGLVFRLGVRFLPRRAALAAAVLFAAHPVHVEAVALGVNQSEMLVAIIGVVMVCRYIDARRAGTMSRREWAIQALLYAAGALCKETAFVLPGLLVAADLTVLARPSPDGRSTTRWRGYVALAVVAVIMFVVRAAVLGGGMVTVVTAKGLAGLGLGERMLMMLEVVPQWLRLLVWPAHLQADYVANEFFPASAIGIHQVAGLVIVVAMLAAILLSRRRAPSVCFGLTWCAVALLPVSNILPTGILMAERTLFLPSVGFLIAVAAAGELIAKRSPSPSVRRSLGGLVAVLVVLGVVRSIGRHAVWNTAHLQIVTRPPVA